MRDVEHFLNYPSERAVVELLTDEEIIESVIDDENDHEPYDNYVIPNVSSKKFKALTTIKMTCDDTKKKYPESCACIIT